MSYRKGGNRNHNAKAADKTKQLLENIDESNPVMKMFKEFSLALDDKHDRHERIVKLSRDITIESKRIIFLLHNKAIDIDIQKEQILKEAKERLDQLVLKQFKAIAIELEDRDSYQYLKAYTAGMQEFIEALVFYQYLKDEKIESWRVINDNFIYNIETVDEETDVTSTREVRLLFPESEFILGIADFTGELMRKCINTLGAGNVDDCFKICGFVKFILTGFIGTNSAGYKEISRKLYVLRQSLAKMEMVCYNIRVRGSEVPKHMLAMVASGVDEEHDEGFYN